MLGLEGDGEMWNYGYEKKVVLISGRKVIGGVGLGLDLWKGEYEVKNIEKMMKGGRVVYEKVVGFRESLEKIGDCLEGGWVGG